MQKEPVVTCRTDENISFPAGRKAVPRQPCIGKPPSPVQRGGLLDARDLFPIAIPVGRQQPVIVFQVVILALELAWEAAKQQGSCQDQPRSVLDLVHRMSLPAVEVGLCWAIIADCDSSLLFGLPPQASCLEGC